MGKPRHILQISHDANGPFAAVCRQYVDSFPDDHVTTIFLKGQPEGTLQEKVGGARVLFLEVEGENLRGFKISQSMRLYKLIKNDQYDLVIAHRYKAIYLAGIMSYFLDLPKLLGITHEHDVFRRLNRKLFVTFWRQQFLIAGVSDSVRQNIAKYCPKLEASGRLFMLPNALPEDYESRIQSRSSAREQLGLGEQHTIIGTVGRLVEKKSFHVLIDAFAKAELGEGVRLVLVGDGPLRETLEEQARSLGVERQVVFKGHVDSAGHLISAFDLFVLPSGVDEAFGFVLLEAMMAKIAVLASNAPGPSQVMGDVGWQFPVGSVAGLKARLKQFMMLSQRERDVMGASGYQRVQSVFTHSQFRKRLAELPLI